MAEEDWYGPFGKLNQWHFFAVTAGVFGLLNLIAGSIGYSLGKRTSIDGGPYLPDPWVGGIIWEQILVGIICLFVITPICYVFAQKSRKK